MSNYPDGAANDPRAPWNQKEPPEFEPLDTENQPDYCEDCGEVDIINKSGACKSCFERTQNEPRD